MGFAPNRSVTCVVALPSDHSGSMSATLPSLPYLVTIVAVSGFVGGVRAPAAGEVAYVHARREHARGSGCYPRAAQEVTRT